MSSFSKLAKRSTWQLETEVSSFAPTNTWSNKDMDPVPVEKRTWSTWNYVAYWISDATNAAVWELASSMLAIGLSWRQALPAIAVGHLIIAAVMVLNGTVGARLHVPFPVLNRSSFGFWFSYFSVISRVVLSLFWFGIQTFTGSECVYQMLKAIWPSVARLPNHLPASANITTSGMMCYLLYWLIQFPFMLISPQKIRWLFVVKAMIVPPTWIAMFIWAFVRVDPSKGLLNQHTTLKGSELGWAWMSALNSALGLYSTLAVNIPDFTRYAKNEQAQRVQLVIIPIAFTLAGFIGIAVTSAGQQLYGETLWDPLRLIDKWDNRAAAFFASFSFLLATLGTNISANSLSAGNDMSALCPRYINIRRGQVICAFTAWIICPWEILNKATGFLAFMNGYTIFLGPFAGIMVTDVSDIRLDNHLNKASYSRSIGLFIGDVLMFPQCTDLMDGTGILAEWQNWRALLALLISVPPNIPGLISSINTKIYVGSGATRLFDIAWLFGFFVASFVYYVASVLFPAPETMLDEAILEDSSDRSEYIDRKEEEAQVGA